MPLQRLVMRQDQLYFNQMVTALPHFENQYGARPIPPRTLR